MNGVYVKRKESNMLGIDHYISLNFTPILCSNYISNISAAVWIVKTIIIFSLTLDSVEYFSYISSLVYFLMCGLIYIRL